MRSYTYHQDPSHGWLEVPLTDLLVCGLHPWDFSEYSYYRNTDRTFFLEEDCDMTRFYKTFHMVHGYYPELKDKFYSGDCVVRCYAHNPMPYPHRAA